VNVLIATLLQVRWWEDIRSFEALEKSASAIVSAYLLRLFIGLLLDGMRTVLPILVANRK
jgi:hypothetical protein